AVLGALGAGRVLGGDALIEKLEPVKKNPALKWLMG
ncbi:MAG: quinol oxidase, partial [Chloroflexi bacterium]|nr:quinol oxidase [Chloroflexota bacterium]